MSPTLCNQENVSHSLQPGKRPPLFAAGKTSPTPCNQENVPHSLQPGKRPPLFATGKTSPTLCNLENVPYSLQPGKRPPLFATSLSLLFIDLQPPGDLLCEQLKGQVRYASRPHPRDWTFNPVSRQDSKTALRLGGLWIDLGDPAVIKRWPIS